MTTQPHTILNHPARDCFTPFAMTQMKISVKRAFIALLWLILLVTSQLAMATQSSAVALMYHHFGDDRYPSTNIRIEQFEQHLEFLETNNFQVLALDIVLNALQSNQALPDKTVVITMDDAYLSVYQEAYPRLKQRNWPFTVFVSTDYIDKRFSNYMSWEQMREMQQHGASFGNHTRSHDHLIKRNNNESEPVWQQRIRDDLNQAQKRLHDELNNVIQVVAYPYGEYDLALARIVESLNLIGMGQHSGAMGPTSDFRFLPRFPMNESYGDLEGFKSKVMSLVMPLMKTPEIDPVTTISTPLLRVELSHQHPPLKQLNCYASGQGKIKVQWLDEHTFTTQTNNALPVGRSRYNCTAPSRQSGRYYWFSQPWIIVNDSDIKNSLTN